MQGLERIVSGGEAEERHTDEVELVVQAGGAVVVLHVTEPELNRREPRIELTNRLALRKKTRRISVKVFITSGVDVDSEVQMEMTVMVMTKLIRVFHL